LDQNLVFSEHFINTNTQLGSLAIFQSKAEERISQIIASHSDKKILIESGEWEGHCAKLFKNANYKNVLKVTRLHTPLATCMRQNDLPASSENLFQLLQEYETIVHADVISACTDHVRAMVKQDVLGQDHELNEGIVTIPNPVDESVYSPGKFSKEQGVAYVNKLLGEEFLTSDGFNVLFLGSVETRKGVEYAIEAIPKILKLNSKVKFCFVGHHGDEGGQLTANSKLSPKELMKKIPTEYQDRVKFTGFAPHSDVPIVIAAGDLFQWRLLVFGWPYLTP